MRSGRDVCISSVYLFKLTSSPLTDQLPCCDLSGPCQHPLYGKAEYNLYICKNERRKIIWVPWPAPHLRSQEQTTGFLDSNSAISVAHNCKNFDHTTASGCTR